MITRQMTPSYYLLFELYPLVYFINEFQDHQNSVACDSSFALCFGL